MADNFGDDSTPDDPDAGAARRDPGSDDAEKPKFTIRGGSESDRAASAEVDGDEDDDTDAKSSRWLVEIVIIVAIVLGLMFVITQFGFRQYVVPSESMEPTLIGCDGCSNDRILVDKMVYRFSDPEPGDVVVFKAPTDSWDGMWQSPRSSNGAVKAIQDVLSWFSLQPPDENNLVKRVIATGGQTVECHAADGKGVTVDGKALNEPYIDKKLQSQMYADSSGVQGGGSCYGPDFGPIKVPDGNVWVMGDNRSNSADSRAHIQDELHGTVPVSDIRGKVRTVIYPFSRFGGVGSDNPQG